MTSENQYVRLKEVKEFDESRIGVKGLLDTGITTIPRFFHQPPENLPSTQPKKNQPQLTVPIIDMSQDRSKVVEEVRRSSSTLGFFQMVNHSVPLALIDCVVNSMKSFYEQSNEYKMKFYHREVDKGASYSTNFDLFHSKGASWRDTFQVNFTRLS